MKGVVRVVVTGQAKIGKTTVSAIIAAALAKAKIEVQFVHLIGSSHEALTTVSANVERVEEVASKAMVRLFEVHTMPNEELSPMDVTGDF